MKARIISSVLVLAACFVLIYAAGSVDAIEKQVNITERTIFGDSAYADGINAGCGGFAGDYGSYRLAWESSYKFAAEASEVELTEGGSLDGLDGNDEFFSDAPYSITQPQREKLWLRL